MIMVVVMVVVVVVGGDGGLWLAAGGPLVVTEIIDGQTQYIQVPPIVSYSYWPNTPKASQ